MGKATNFEPRDKTVSVDFFPVVQMVWAKQRKEAALAWFPTARTIVTDQEEGKLTEAFFAALRFGPLRG